MCIRDRFGSEGKGAGTDCQTLACALDITILCWSDRSGGFPRLSLLRTVRATFTAYGSSTLKVTMLPGNTKSGSLTHGISSPVVLIPKCTIWVSFTIDKDVSFDMSIRGMF